MIPSSNLVAVVCPAYWPLVHAARRWSDAGLHDDALAGEETLHSLPGDVERDGLHVIFGPVGPNLQSKRAVAPVGLDQELVQLALVPGPEGLAASAPALGVGIERVRIVGLGPPRSHHPFRLEAEVDEQSGDVRSRGKDTRRGHSSLDAVRGSGH